MGGGGTQTAILLVTVGKKSKNAHTHLIKKTKQLFRTEILYNVKVMVLIPNQLYFHLTFPPHPKNLVRT